MAPAHKTVWCDCGHEASASDDERLVAEIERHAAEEHGMRLTRDEALLIAFRAELGELPTAKGAELTPRQREILRWVALGKTNREIARLLFISPGTVRKHMDNVFAALGVRTRTAAVVAMLRRQGLA